MKPIDRIANTNGVVSLSLSSVSSTSFMSSSSSSSSPLSRRMSMSLCWRSVAIVLLLLHCAFPTTHTTATPVTMTLVPSSTTSPTFIVTETAVIECRADIALEQIDYQILLVWNNPLNKSIDADVIDRKQVQMKPEPSTPTLIRSTLTLTNVSTSDSGTYRCIAVDSSNRTLSHVEINIKVSDEVGRCGFESTSGLCGWTVVAGTTSSWLRRNCTDELAHADHTYGPTSNVGHYMKIEPTATDSANTSSPHRPAMLISPIMTASPDKAQCFSMWYIVQGDAQLSVQRKTDLLTTTLETFNSSSAANATEGDWKQATVRIPPAYNITYQISLTFSVSNCATCNNATLLVDDVRLAYVGCHDDETGSNKNNALIFTPLMATTFLPSNVPTSPRSNSGSITSTFEITNAQSTDTSSTSSSTSTTSTTTTTSTSATSTMTSSSTSASTMKPTNSISIDGPPAVSVEQRPGRIVTQEIESTLSTSVAVDDSLSYLNEKTTNDEPQVQNGAASNSGSNNNNNTGLAIGIVLAVMSAGACTAAVLYRRKRRGRKSTYITFGNPSYSREHLPANDFSLDSPLTLSSNGYTVLA